MQVLLLQRRTLLLGLLPPALHALLRGREPVRERLASLAAAYARLPAIRERLPRLRRRWLRRAREPLGLGDQLLERGVQRLRARSCALSRDGVLACAREAALECRRLLAGERREGLPRLLRVRDLALELDTLERLDALTQGRARRESLLERVAGTVQLCLPARHAGRVAQHRLARSGELRRDLGPGLGRACELVPLLLRVTHALRRFQDVAPAAQHVHRRAQLELARARFAGAERGRNGSVRGEQVAGALAERLRDRPAGRDRPQGIGVAEPFEGADREIARAVAEHDAAQDRVVLDAIERTLPDDGVAGVADDVAQEAIAGDPRERGAPDVLVRRADRDRRQPVRVGRAGERPLAVRDRAVRTRDPDEGLAGALTGELAESMIGVAARDP